MSKGSKLSMLLFAGLTTIMSVCSFIGGHSCGICDRIDEEEKYLNNLMEEEKKED